MTSTEMPIEVKLLENFRIGEFLQALASDAMSPGAGTAGGFALALAAACAGKAVAITRRHGDSAVLKNLQIQLADLAANALLLAQKDALQFKRQLKSEDPATASALLRTDLTILEACSTLDKLLKQHKQAIAENMTGDWHAARALSQACRLIHEENVQELKNDKAG